jgi:hypothetical protein
MADNSTLVTKAKVSGVVAESQIALNKGENDDIKLDDQVTLYRSVEVTDPDSGERLGSVQFPRLKLKVNLVATLYCVAVVTDYRPDAEPFNPIRVRRLKRVTEDPDEASANVVYVKRGEEATVRREQDESE